MTEPTNGQNREHWGSRIGLILAMAGNAVGLGNFLRFPTQAAANGGGAFMIPYFIAFLLLGIPLMWIEWGLGRYGGSFGRGTMPAVFNRLWRNPLAKYAGALSIMMPFLVLLYYNYIESWTLAYSYFSITGQYQNLRTPPIDERSVLAGLATADGAQPDPVRVEQALRCRKLELLRAEMRRFLGEFQGIRPKVRLRRSVTPDEEKRVELEIEPDAVPADLRYDPARDGAWDEKDPAIDHTRCPYREVRLRHKYFADRGHALMFFIITFLLNAYCAYRGVNAGIEKLAKIAMPLLFVFATILAVRVYTLGQPAGSAWSVGDGYTFLWSPDFSTLGSAKVWLAAAGQIFFTLSLGMGSIQAYASYLSNKDDIVLTGLATASTNELAEVVLGGSIAIPAAVAFFGPAMTTEIARNGSFDLGFNSLPMVFSQIEGGQLFGALWYALLFFAGITSSVAMLMVPITFLKDDLKLSHNSAHALTQGICLVAGLLVIYFFEYNVVDEMDFWGGSFGLVVFALIEVILFVWVFGVNQAWREMHNGCDLTIPRAFKFIMKYVTPVYIAAIMITWGAQDGWPTLIMAAVTVTNRPVIWFTRLALIALLSGIFFLVWHSQREETGESWLVPAGLSAWLLTLIVVTYPRLTAISPNALVFMFLAWSGVTLLAAFCIAKMLSVPAVKHDDFVEDMAAETTVAAERDG